jgi:hypothetical protein
MAHVPLALSVHSFIDKVGSDAGFASIIGLAILVLLYFAQARETSTLRDEAELSGQRVAQLEAQLSQLGRAQSVAQAPAAQAAPGTQASAQPAPVAAAAGKGAGAVGLVNPGAQAVPAGATAAQVTARAGALIPHPPAGVGAPALAAATRLIPIATATPAAEAQAPPVGTQAPPAAAQAPPAGATVPPPTPAPATFAGAANGANELPPPPPISQPLPRVQLRPEGATAPGRIPSPAVARRSAPARSRISRGLVLLITAIGIVAVVVILLIATSGGGGNKPAASAGTRTSNAPAAGGRKSRRHAFDPSNVTVTVLNGTATAGAAARVSSELGGAGYKQGLTTNAAQQTQTTTTVAYLPGHKADALQVANTLKLGPHTVAAIDPNNQAIACPSTGSCTSDVVVILGADLASQ